MRITRFHIDRFGVLADQDVPDLSSGMNIFLGRNEAGKSTCLQFFRAMLFNYRRGRTTLDPMPTKKSTLAGGSLFLHTKRFGDIVLTRRPEKGGTPELRHAGGAPLAESDLHMLLQGMTAEVFDNVFAFNLKSLMEVTSLNGESVRHALHGAAFGLGMRSPSQVLKHLDDRMSALLKRDRIDSQAGINNNLQALINVQEELTAQGPDMRRYADIQVELETTERRIAEITQKKDTLALQLLDAQRRLSLWPQWEHVRRLQAERALCSDEERSLAAACTFTPDALQRLDILLAQQEERTLAAAAHSAALARLETEIQPHAAAHLVPLLDALRGLREQKGIAKSDADALIRLAHEETALHLLQEQDLARLGWDEATLALADTSLAAKDSIRQQESRLNERAAALALQQQECVRLQEEHRQAGELCAAARQEADVAPPALMPEETHVDSLMAALTAAQNALAETPALAARKEDTATQAAQALQDIHPGWTPETLAAADISLPARHAFHTAGENMLAAEEALRQTTAQATAAEQNLARAAEEAAAAEQQLAVYADIPEDTVLEQRMALLKRMELCAHDARQAQKRYEDANATLSDLVAPRRAEAGGRAGQEASPHHGSTHQGSVLRSPWLLAGLTCGAAAGVSSFFGMGEPTPLLLYIGAGLAVCAALLLGIALVRKPRNEAAPAPSGENEQAQQQCILARTAAEQEHNRARTMLLSLAEEARPWLPTPPQELPSETALAGAMHMLEGQRQRRVLYERDFTGYQTAARALEAAREQSRRHTLLRTEAEEHLRSQKALWGRQLRTMHLPEHTTPAALQGFFDRVLFARAQAASAAEAAATAARALGRVALCLETARTLPFCAPSLEPWERRFANAFSAANGVAHTGATTEAPTRQPVEQPLLPGIVLETNTSAASPHGHITPAHLERLLQQPETRGLCAEGLACIATALAELRTLREQEQARKAALALVEEREKTLARIAERHTAAIAKQEQTRAELEQTTVAWQRWLAAHRLAPTLSPATATEAVDLIVLLRTREKEKAKAAADQDMLRARLQHFQDAVVALADKAALPLPEGFVPGDLLANLPPVLETLERLNRQAEEAALAATRQQEQRVRLEEIKVSLEQAQQAIGATNAALAALLQAAQTHDPEVFRTRFAQWERHAALERDERSLMAVFHTAASDAGHEPEYFLTACAAQSRESLEHEHATLAETLDALETERASLDETRGSLRERQTALVSGKGSAPLRQEAALLQDQLREHAREWQVLALARHLLLTAKGQFEKEGQQGVIGTAGRLFAAITEGEYTGITLNLEDEGLSVIHHSGALKDPEKSLSQGSREQLYLALRLAYIQNHALNAEPVPVIMDDILVNFDPHRMAQTAATLATFAASNQILFFTCHPHMADMLRDAGKAAQTAGTSPMLPGFFQVHKGSIRAGQ